LPHRCEGCNGYWAADLDLDQLPKTSLMICCGAMLPGAWGRERGVMARLAYL
jgi:hypothetical protein